MLHEETDMETRQVAYTLLGNAHKPTYAPHPYYPLEAQIVGYLPNEHSVLYLLSVASIACAVLLVSTYAAAKWQNPVLQTHNIAIVMWFVLCKIISSSLNGHIMNPPTNKSI